MTDHIRDRTTITACGPALSEKITNTTDRWGTVMDLGGVAQTVRRELRLRWDPESGHLLATVLDGEGVLLREFRSIDILARADAREAVKVAVEGSQDGTGEKPWPP